MEPAENEELNTLAEAMYLACTSADKLTRERSELVIYDFERSPGQMVRLFKVLHLSLQNPARSESLTVRKACFAHLSRYIKKQFTLGNS